MREAGASDQEIKQAIDVSLSVRDNAKLIMASHGFQHLGVRHDVKDVDYEKTTRIRELVSIAAAFSVNCTTNLEKHIAASGAVGIAPDEINTVLDAALFIKGEAGHYVGQIAKLKAEKDQLQDLLEKLKQTQAQLVQSEKMAALGRLVAGLVHEINTPVGALNSSADTSTRAITNIVEILEQGKTLTGIKSDRQFQASVAVLRRNLPTSRAASERISGIIASLKSFIGLDESTLQETNLHEALESILLLMKHEFKGKINIVKEYGEIPLITGNAAELNQVFMSLLRNAVSAIKSRGTITLTTSLQEGNVRIAITDNGVGIGPEQITKLFEPTFTSKESRVKAGLGLFISDNIVRKHGGKIIVKSKMGKGSTFTVVLPAKLEKLPEVVEAIQSDSQVSRCDKLR